MSLRNVPQHIGLIKTAVTASSVPGIRTPQILKMRSDAAKSNSDDGNSNLPKHILEYIFLAGALVILLSVILTRFIILKRKNQADRAFSVAGRTYPRFEWSNHLAFPGTSGTVDSLSHVQSTSTYIGGYPAAYLGHGRPTHSQDIDGSGRRLGNFGYLDHDGVLGSKDTLPAYHKHGSPPKYHELEFQRRPTHGSSRPTDEQPSISVPNEVSPNGLSRPTSPT